MRAVILAGGLGTRLAEETDVRPKPMVEVGYRPLLWHIMKHLAGHGIDEFFIALGYRGEVIKRYFLEYAPLHSDLTISLANGAVTSGDHDREDWLVHLVDTGYATNTGGRIRRLRQYLADEPFMLTYGDGVSNVDIGEVIKFHQTHGRLATVTAVRPPSRFGALNFEPGEPVKFVEKPQMGEGWINGGFMVLEPEVIDQIDGDTTSLEGEVLETLANKGELMAYAHEGFWQCADTLRELSYLRGLWSDGSAPWKTWP
jgi:glucose-1-phosphate cytidylyltransferase